MEDRRNEPLSNAGEHAKQRASAAADDAQRSAQATADTWRNSMMNTVGDVAEALDAAAGSLRGKEPWLADATEDLSQNVRHFAEGGRSKSFDELRHDLEGIARRNPTLFMMGALAIGVGVSRLLKSAPPAEPPPQSEHGPARPGTAATPVAGSLSGPPRPTATAAPGVSSPLSGE